MTVDQPAPAGSPDPAEATELDISMPFSRADALSAGLKQSTLRGLRFKRLFAGVYVAADAPATPLQRVQAALIPFHGNGFASHASAARVYGLAIPALPEEHVTVVEPRHRRTHPGIVCHVVRRGQTVRIDGVDVSAPEQLFVELADQLTLVDLVVVGDQLVRDHGVRPDGLRAYAAASRLRGFARAKEAAAYVRAGVRSPMETRLRMLLVLAGLPEPEINTLVGSENGTKRQHDLLYRVAKVAVEYDGRQHVEVVQQWESDLERREDADDDGWRIVVVIVKGVFVEPEKTVLRVWRLLRERGEPGVPATLSDAWRPHFPGRG